MFMRSCYFIDGHRSVVCLGWLVRDAWYMVSTQIYDIWRGHSLIVAESIQILFKIYRNLLDVKHIAIQANVPNGISIFHSWLLRRR